MCMQTSGLTLSPEAEQRFARYAELLVEWNATRMNLTRLTAPDEIAVAHFYSSLAVCLVHEIPQNASILDIGTGAGFPGIPLKIYRRDTSLTLLEATAKKLTFCKTVCEDLGIGPIIDIHGRAEDAPVRQRLHDQFDLVTARGVAPLEKLLPWAAPYIAPGGAFVAWKGPSAAAEMAAAKPIARSLRLRCSLKTVKGCASDDLSDEMRRPHHYVVCRRED